VTKTCKARWKQISTTENTVPAAGRLTERHALLKPHPNNHRFDLLRNSIDMFQELCANGIGFDSKSAKEILEEEAAQMWEQGLLGNDCHRLCSEEYFLEWKELLFAGQ